MQNQILGQGEETEMKEPSGEFNLSFAIADIVFATVSMIALTVNVLFWVSLVCGGLAGFGAGSIIYILLTGRKRK
jgi:hypothetical protein